jgi:hypothetical protein
MKPTLFRSLLVLAGTLMILAGAGQAHAQFILNGSFENPKLPPGSSGVSDATDWTVGYLRLTNGSAVGGTTQFGTTYVLIGGGRFRRA